jgi:phosphinothricin acetyltransferase
MLARGETDMTIREAVRRDLPGINAIYADAVRRTTATFDVTPPGKRERRRWFRQHGAGHPLVVADDGSTIAGWGSLSAWSGRCAYGRTVEISIYVRDEYRRRGVGRLLAEDLLERAVALSLHVVIAQIAEGNAGSVALFHHLGFHRVGVLREVGEKFDRLLDVEIWERILGSP